MSRETSRGTATVRQLCTAFCISRQAYYQVDKSQTRVSTTRQCPWPSVEQLKVGIQEIVKEHSAWGVRKVWASLRQQGIRSGMKRVYFLMKNLGLCFAAAERKEKRHYGHITVPESNRRWASDLTTAWTSHDGWVAIVPVIDCGDRFVFSINVTKRQEAPDVLLPIEQALWQQFRRPENVPHGLELRTRPWFAVHW